MCRSCRQVTAKVSARAPVGSQRPSPPRSCAGGTLREDVRARPRVPGRAFGTNCYVVAPGRREQCVVVDPGIERRGPARRGPARAPAAAGRGPADPRPPRPHLLRHAGLRARRASRRTSTPTTATMLEDPVKYLSTGDVRAVRRPPDVDRARRRAAARPAATLQLAGLTHRRRPRARAHPGLGRLPSAGHEVDGEPTPAAAVRRRAVRRLDRAHRPARWRLGADARPRCASVILPMADETVVLPGPRAGDHHRTRAAGNPFLQDLPPDTAVPGAVMAGASRSGAQGRPRLRPAALGAALLAVREALTRAAAPGRLRLHRAAGLRGHGAVRPRRRRVHRRRQQGDVHLRRPGRALADAAPGGHGGGRPGGRSTHGLERGALPVKLWYAGPMFRYERPQAGRQRQFTQVGAEALGSDDPALDAEVVAPRRPGVPVAGPDADGAPPRDARRPARTRGRPQRPTARVAAAAALGRLDDETDARAASQPAARARRQAARGAHALDGRRPADDRRHLLRAQKAAPRRRPRAPRRPRRDVLDDPRLVRGLDYYTRTTFEFVHAGARRAVRHRRWRPLRRPDGEAIGGPPLPGIGFGLGVDRTLLALEAEGVRLGRRHALRRLRGAARRAAKAGAR